MYNFGFNNYSPYEMPRNTLVRVTGMEGAKAYQMGINSTVALFDSNEDLMYIKSTDGAGFPTIRTFKFEELTTQTAPTTNNYVSREEMEEYVKQFIQQQANKQPKQAKPSATCE